MGKKCSVNRRYNLSLLNTNPNLDLTQKQKEINDAISKMLNGGEHGVAYNNVTNIKVLKIGTRTLQLECSEFNKEWHMHLGYELANNYDMRNFCDKLPNGSNDIMFQWY